MLPGGTGFNDHTMQSSAPHVVDAAHRLGLPANGSATDHLICIYPAMALGMSPGTALWLSVMPKTAHSLIARASLALMPDESGEIDERIGAEAWAGCMEFLNEDIAVVESIQKGMRAGTGNRAPLHPWEATNWQFSQDVIRRLGVISD